MKNQYVKPEMQVEEYSTKNCYAKKCENQTGTTYKFTCDAAGGSLYYFSNYPASGTQPKTGSTGTYIGDYHPCGSTHSADTQAGFYWGYVDKSHGSGFNYKRADGKLDADELVIVWRGANGRNGHATTNLDINNWEIEVPRS